MEPDPLTESIIAACIEVHRHLGPGLLESAYEHCLCHERSLRTIPFRRQVPLPIVYKGFTLDCAHRIDILVRDRVVVEIKSVEELNSVHVAQTVTYLRLGRFPTGLLVNFNVALLKRGLRRLTWNAPSTGEREHGSTDEGTT